MRRSHFLRLCSLLSMLASLVRALFGIMMINFFSTALSFGSVSKGEIRLANLAAALLMLGALTLLTCGFLGALNWEEPLRAANCAKWGGAALLLGVGGNLLQGMIGYGVSYVAWTTGAIVPGLFFLAALHFALRAGKE